MGSAGALRDSPEEIQRGNCGDSFRENWVM